MALQIRERRPSAQIAPAKKAAALKVENDTKKTRPPLLQEQIPAPPIETSFAPEPERVSKANRSQGPPRWAPDPLVAKRYQVSGRTLRRWDEDPGLGFPPVIIINSRRYRELAALEEWERHTAANARTAKAKRLKQFADQPSAEGAV